MKITTRSKKDKGVTNYKVFNATLLETDRGIRIVGVYGTNDPEMPEEQWQRLDGRNFARALRDSKFVTWD
jgi:hypothetical protein